MNLTPDLLARLSDNGRKAEQQPGFDPTPVVKIFLPDGGATWLLCWTDPANPDIAYGLCDLGTGFPEFGPVLLSEIGKLRGAIGLPPEIDLSWTSSLPLSELGRMARRAGRIVD